MPKTCHTLLIRDSGPTAVAPDTQAAPCRARSSDTPMSLGPSAYAPAVPAPGAGAGSCIGIGDLGAGIVLRVLYLEK